MSEKLKTYPRFENKKVLITGGLGFIGSSLALKLVESGADVTLCDAMIEGYGGNLFNIEPIRDRVTINFNDVRDHNAMNYLVQGRDYIFHLAGQNNHVMSLTNPFPDIDINIKGTTIVMEACRHFAPGCRVIYTGTRGEYGPSARLPVSEDAPMDPRGIYEISNLTAEKIVRTYHRVHGVKAVLLRLTNTYGPRAQMIHDQYCVVNWFIRLALENRTIKVFGDGGMLRDFLYVEDAVDAILTSALTETAYGDIFNVGVDKPHSILEMAELIIKISGTGNWTFAPFTPERLAQEPGDFYSDISKIRSRIGWEPGTSLETGLSLTIDYYRSFRDHYWNFESGDGKRLAAYPQNVEIPPN